MERKETIWKDFAKFVNDLSIADAKIAKIMIPRSKKSRIRFGTDAKKLIAKHAKRIVHTVMKNIPDDGRKVNEHDESGKTDSGA